MTLTNFIKSLIDNYNQIQLKNNCSHLINKIIAAKKCQLWAISEDKNEYNRFHRMMDGSLVNTIDTENINSSLLINSAHYFREKEYFIVAHDPSEIRKPHSKKTAELCLVKDFNGKLINGYKTHNSVVFNAKGKELRLLQTTPYSTNSTNYISQEELKDFKKKKLTNPQREQEISELLENGQWHNLKTITKQHTKSITDAIRAENPDAVIVDVYDRGFDDAEIFEFETELNNLFVIRAKLSRNSNELKITNDGKEQFVKLRNQQFFKSSKKHYSKVRFKNKTYCNLNGVFEYNYVEIKGKTYSVVRARIYTRKGQSIFEEPMLLITNMDITFDQMAEMVFEIYMKRSKIEGVFKFCKDVLGWEEIQIPEFYTVKNLLSLVFFISGYFYEIEDELTKDPNIQWLAEFGGGKGKITRYYILTGIARLISYNLTQQYIKEHKITQQEIDEAVNKFTAHTE